MNIDIAEMILGAAQSEGNAESGMEVKPKGSMSLLFKIRYFEIVQIIHCKVVT